ncbi:MAG: DnaJ domain-containing protein, partial [Thermodesulfovibrionales bacterium]|nr:DnaJ domain-containing protein [Thermodesulfovibrionales bacterium]
RVKSGGKVVRVSKRNDGVCLGISRLGLLHGSLEDFELSNVLLGLQRSAKTGVIFIKSGNIQKSVYFKSGDMIFASSSLVEDRLGDVLMRQGRITLDQYKESSEVMKRDGKRHGTVLVEMGFISPKELFSAVKLSVEHIIMSLFSISSGDFLFKEGELPSEEVIMLKLSAANLIYRGIKAVREIGIIKDMCPSAGEVLHFSSDPLDLFQDLMFEDEDRKILTAIDGKRTLKEIVDQSGHQPLDAMRSVCALLSTRIIEVVDSSATNGLSAEDVPIDEMFREHHDEQEEYRAERHKIDTARQDKEPTMDEDMEDAAGEKQRADGMVKRIEEMFTICEEHDYYDVLGVGKSPTNTEIKRAYYLRAKDFHPDKHYHLPANVKDKLNRIFTSITTAYSTLSSPDLKVQYDKDPMKGRANVLDPAERAIYKFDEANDLMRKGDNDEAASTFAEAAYLDSENPKYHYYCGYALARAGKHKEAERAMQRAIKLDPFNADYLAEQGHVYLALGFNLRAKGTFEKALKISAMHKRSMEGLSALPDE